MENEFKTFASSDEAARIHLQKLREAHIGGFMQRFRGRCIHGEIDIFQAGYGDPNSPRLLDTVYVCPDCAALYREAKLPAGDITVIVGPKGSGKTYLADSLTADELDAEKIDDKSGEGIFNALKNIPVYTPVVICLQKDKAQVWFKDFQMIKYFANGAGRKLRFISLLIPSEINAL